VVCVTAAESQDPSTLSPRYWCWGAPPRAVGARQSADNGRMIDPHADAIIAWNQDRV